MSRRFLSSIKPSAKTSMKQQTNIPIMNVMSSEVPHFSSPHHSRPHSFDILGEQKRYTFKSFQNEVDSLAASLLELGFEKNDRLAVWLPNTSENVAMTFAASKLGLIKVNDFFLLTH